MIPPTIGNTGKLELLLGCELVDATVTITVVE
jgi:hypothetical protein